MCCMHTHRMQSSQSRHTSPPPPMPACTSYAHNRMNITSHAHITSTHAHPPHALLGWLPHNGRMGHGGTMHAYPAGQTRYKQRLVILVILLQYRSTGIKSCSTVYSTEGACRAQALRAGDVRLHAVLHAILASWIMQSASQCMPPHTTPHHTTLDVTLPTHKVWLNTIIPAGQAHGTCRAGECVCGGGEHVRSQSTWGACRAGGWGT